MRPRVQECEFCGEEFMNDTTKLRVYCSKVCRGTSRYEYVQIYNRKISNKVGVIDEV